MEPQASCTESRGTQSTPAVGCGAGWYQVMMVLVYVCVQVVVY